MATSNHSRMWALGAVVLALAGMSGANEDILRQLDSLAGGSETIQLAVARLSGLRAAVIAAGVPEARQIADLLTRRLRR